MEVGWHGHAPVFWAGRDSRFLWIGASCTGLDLTPEFGVMRSSALLRHRLFSLGELNPFGFTPDCARGGGDVADDVDDDWRCNTGAARARHPPSDGRTGLPPDSNRCESSGEAESNSGPLTRDLVPLPESLPVSTAIKFLADLQWGSNASKAHASATCTCARVHVPVQHGACTLSVHMHVHVMVGRSVPRRGLLSIGHRLPS